MVITKNIVAMNAQRQFNIVTKCKEKHTEKLSSGYRINRAADDAAGLAISEKMRRQIRGLRQGMDNIQDGISMCKVADGALEEVHDMLHRMGELAVKAANGTLTNTDREYIDAEVQHLKKEINRIGETTTFNERRVFGGNTWQEVTFIPTATGAFFQLMGDNASHTGYMEEPLDSAKLASLPNTGMSPQGNNPFVSVHVDFDTLIDKNHNIQGLINTQFYVNCCTNCCAEKVVFTDDVGMSVVGNELRVGVKKAEGQYYDSAEEFCAAIVNAAKDRTSHVEFAYEGSRLYIYDIDADAWTEKEKKLAIFSDVPETGVKPVTANNGIRIKMSGAVDDAMIINIGDLNTKVMQIVTGNCLTKESAESLISNLKVANSYVSELRSRIGAYINRLEHGYNTNGNTHENTTAAESRIRDTDMAQEMVSYSIANILTQAGISMMTQANVRNQDVLVLLR